MRRLSFLSLAFILFMSLSFSACSKFSAKIDLKEGTDLYESRKYEEAIKKFNSALEKDPTLHVAYLDLGLSYMAMYVPGSTHPKDLAYVEESIKAFKKYQELHPEDPKVNEYLITIYLNADRKEDAIQYFEEQLAKDNTNTAFMQKLAFLYAQSGKFEDALRWYQRRATVEPNNPEAYYIIGVICWEKSYKFADITPEQRERLVKIGMDALDKAIRINPSYADAYLYMNLLYREQAKLIALTPDAVPEDRIDEYNGLLEKAKEYQQKAIALKQQAAASPS